MTETNHSHGNADHHAPVHGGSELGGSGHGHTHGVADPSVLTSARGIWATKVSLAALLATAAFQVVVVVFTGSIALLADTVHNISDAATAVPLWIAFSLATRMPTKRFSYGYGRAEDLAGLIIVLVLARQRHRHRLPVHQGNFQSAGAEFSVGSGRGRLDWIPGQRGRRPVQDKNWQGNQQRGAGCRRLSREGRRSLQPGSRPWQPSEYGWAIHCPTPSSDW